MISLKNAYILNNISAFVIFAFGADSLPACIIDIRVSAIEECFLWMYSDYENWNKEF